MDQNFNDDIWIYSGGELYHAGVKGMKWGKHLPGTDWWKETTSNYLDSARTKYVPGGNIVYREPTFGHKVVANIKTAGQAAKIYGRKARLAGKIVSKQARAAITRGAYKVAKGTSKLWNQAKGYSSDQVNKLREFAKSAYSSARSSVQNYFRASLHSDLQQKVSSKTPMSHLDQFQNKQMRDAVSVYTQGKTDGSFGNTLNQWFQNAQYGIVKGVNQYLKQIGLDDEVDSFISKFKGESAYGKKRRLDAQSQNLNLPNKQDDIKKGKNRSFYV